MKATVLLEIKSGEGGADSKLLVNDMLSVYKKAANQNNFSLTVLELFVSNMRRC